MVLNTKNSLRNMKNINRVLILFITTFILISCSGKRNFENKVSSSKLYLPDSFKHLDSTHLLPILEMLGKAEIIGLSESSHYFNEPLDFRNELIKFLVIKKRIDVVALESGIIESRLLYDYVNGADEDIDSVLYNGLSWTFDHLAQNRELIEWLNAYNQDSSNSHKVKLYGFDIPGSPLNPRANRKINISIVVALDYLKIVDFENWKVLQKRMKPLMEYLNINISNPELKQYFHLEKFEREELRAIVEELLRLFEIHELNYLKHSSKEDFEWAYLAARSAKNIDDWLQTFPLGFELSPDIRETIFSPFFWKLHGKRDKTMANNIDWIKSREKEANLLLFGHLNHMSKSTQTLVLNDSTTIIKEKQLGQYLDSKYHHNYKLIGNFNFESTRLNNSSAKPEQSFENFLAERDSSHYCYLTSKKDEEWMNKEWQFG